MRRSIQNIIETLMKDTTLAVKGIARKSKQELKNCKLRLLSTK